MDADLTLSSKSSLRFLISPSLHEPTLDTDESLVEGRHQHRVSHNDPVPDVPPRLLSHAPHPLRHEAPLQQRRGLRVDALRPQVDVEGLHHPVGAQLGEAPEAAELADVLLVVAQVARHEFQGDRELLEGSIGGEEEGLVALGLDKRKKRGKLLVNGSVICAMSFSTHPESHPGDRRSPLEAHGGIGF